MPVILPRIDPPPTTSLGSFELMDDGTIKVPDDFKRWLANLVDVLNEALDLIQADLP